MSPEKTCSTLARVSRAPSSCSGCSSQDSILNLPAACVVIGPSSTPLYDSVIFLPKRNPLNTSGLLGPRPLGEHLEDRREPGEEAATGGPQVERPHPGPLGAGQAKGVLEPRVEALDPVLQSLGVVLAQPLYMAGLEARSLDRVEHPRQVQRSGVRED